MPATLAFDTVPVFAPFKGRRSYYEQVAVCPEEDVLDFCLWDKKVGNNPPKEKQSIKLYWTRDFHKPIRAKAHDLQMRWLTDKLLKEVEAVRQQLTEKQEYFAGIDQKFLFQTAQQVALWLWAVASPTHLTTTLTYNQSLHIRAGLPHGAVHFSVLFSPGIDPNATATLGEDEVDNTVLSVYDAQGQYTGGIVGPLPQALLKLPELLPAAR